MGVSTKNLMARTGHDNERAALHYQHRSANGDHIIADGLDALVRAERDQDDDEDRGAAGTGRVGHRVQGVRRELVHSRP